MYNSVQEKTSANEECCGLNKISKGLGCCNYQGFNPYTHVCADHSSMEDGRFDLFNHFFFNNVHVDATYFLNFLYL